MVGSTSMVWAAAGFVPRPCPPGRLTNRGTGATPATLSAVTSRSGAPGRKETPWSAATTTSERSYMPVRPQVVQHPAQQPVGIAHLQQVGAPQAAGQVVVARQAQPLAHGRGHLVVLGHRARAARRAAGPTGGGVPSRAGSAAPAGARADALGEIGDVVAGVALVGAADQR